MRRAFGFECGRLGVREGSQILFEGERRKHSLSGFPRSEGFGRGGLRPFCRTLRQGNDRGREDEGPGEAHGGGCAGKAEPSRSSGTGKERHGFLQRIHTPAILRVLNSPTRMILSRHAEKVKQFRKIVA